VHEVEVYDLEVKPVMLPLVLRRRERESEHERGASARERARERESSNGGCEVGEWIKQRMPLPHTLAVAKGAHFEH
jgi:hypothetical protein